MVQLSTNASTPSSRSDSKYCIYGLVDPRTQEIRYVGRSSSGAWRGKSHVFPCNLSKDRTHRGYWIRELQKAGCQYMVRVLESVCSSDELDVVEKKWIALARQSGWPLTNHTDGGGGHAGHKMSTDTRAKMSSAHKGRKFTKEWRERISAANKGRKLTEEQRKKISDAHRGKKLSPEHREKIRRAAHNWDRQDPAYRKKLRQARLGKKFSKEWCEHISNARSKPIVDTTTGQRYKSQKVAAEELGLCLRSVNRVLRGKLSQTGGHSFVYNEPMT